MRRSWLPSGFLLLLLSASCMGPTEQDIRNSLDAQLHSVTGEWMGASTGENPIALQFRLEEGSNGQVTGSGTMKEQSAASPVPITVSGTYRRPTLSLTFSGMVYEGRDVQGVIAGDYTTVGGVLGPLQLTGSAYSRALEVLLQER